MFTHADLTRLDQSLRDETVLSIYVNGEVSDVAARAQWRTELRNQLDALEQQLGEATHAERESFAAARALAWNESETFTPGDGAPGWMGLFTGQATAYAAIVPVPVPTIATWSPGVYLPPAIRVLKESNPVLVAIADSTHVRIYRYVGRSLELVTTLERDAKVDQPYHMGRPAAPGFGSGTRGRTGTDAAQRELRKATEQVLAEAATTLGGLAGDDAWVLIGGIPVTATALHGRLEPRIAARAAVVSIDVNAADAELAAAVREHVSERRAARDLERIDQILSAAAAGGTGATGLPEIDRALFHAQVHELFVTSVFVRDHPEEAQAAIRRAFDEGATVEHVSGEAAERLDAEGGIAARLRFTLTPVETAT